MSGLQGTHAAEGCWDGRGGAVDCRGVRQSVVRRRELRDGCGERPDGWAKVRGKDPTDPAGVRELDVLIPPAEWGRIRAQLRA